MKYLEGWSCSWKRLVHIVGYYELILTFDKLIVVYVLEKEFMMRLKLLINQAFATCLRKASGKDNIVLIIFVL